MTGLIIAGRYELHSLLGRGGMGEVWAAYDTLIQRRVAIKLLPHPIDGDEGMDLFLREARTAGGLNHPGVVTVFDLGQEVDGTLYLVMELVPGRDLAAVLRNSGRLSLADVIGWTAQAADALAVAHAAGILHRDLKPANLMLTRTGIVKILDFGIARYASTATQASRIIGTVSYMPPERLIGKAGDGRSDLYSLGCMLHELLTGTSPFGDVDTAAMMFAHLHRAPEPPSTSRADIPIALDQLVLDLLAKEPEQRPATANQVSIRLRALLNTPDTPRTPQTPTDGPTSLIPAPPARPATAPTLRVPATTRRLTHPPATPWIHDTGSSSLSSPVVANDTLYVSDQAGNYALDAATGARKWHNFANGGSDNLPTPTESIIYIGGNRGLAYALDATTGTERWVYRTRDDRFTTPTIAAGTVYLGSDERKVYALDPATGAERWIQPVAEAVSAQPTVADGTVYVSTMYGRLYALDARTGQVRWTYVARGTLGSSPVIFGHTVYLACTEGIVYSLDMTSGTERWTYDVGASDGFDASPFVDAHSVYLSSQRSTVFALEAVNGTERWTRITREPAEDGEDDDQCTPTVVNDTLYTCIGDGIVLAIDARTGTQRWNRWIGNGGAVGSPTVAGSLVYVCGAEGRVYALDADTGLEPSH
ncbi:PQQ-binding-like beta-propeller repeat protein [Streptomyces sp. NPDC057565]|uniref:protein kinase domain-containing protein n=1 Tax=Streptomyces sp. NPDC057565 TaxID=3346169 RepID=UPI00368B68BA